MNDDEIQEINFSVIEFNSLVPEDERRAIYDDVNVAVFNGHYGQARIIIPNRDKGIALAKVLTELSEKLLDLYTIKVLH
jgi:hypothetical protein